MDAPPVSRRVAAREHSAGVVIFHGTPREYLLLHYPSGHWDFPKGHVEAGESELQAAVREVDEETGLKPIQIIPGFEHTYEYYYKRDQQTMHKKVTYFAGHADSADIRLSHEHRGFTWLPYEKALQRITFDNARDLLRKAERHLQSIAAH